MSLELIIGLLDGLTAKELIKLEKLVGKRKRVKQRSEPTVLHPLAQELFPGLEIIRVQPQTFNWDDVVEIKAGKRALYVFERDKHVPYILLAMGSRVIIANDELRRREYTLKMVDVDVLPSTVNKQGAWVILRKYGEALAQFPTSPEDALAVMAELSKK